MPPTSPPADILWLVVDAAAELLDELDEWYDSDYEVFLGASPHRGRMCVLCACALTCKAMLGRARFHLYGSITLYERSRLSSFARTLAECDDLALMVKHLKIGPAEFVSAADDELDMPFPPHVVARLSNIHSLEICGGRDSSSMPLTWISRLILLSL